MRALVWCLLGDTTRAAIFRRRAAAGAVLLEVILALMLFVAAATVIASALKASTQALDRLRLDTHAADLAVSVLSEVQLGLKPLAPTGPENFEPPFESWNWELIVHSAEEQFSSKTALQAVEVVIRHEDNAVTYRLAQIFPPPAVESEEDLFAQLPPERAARHAAP